MNVAMWRKALTIIPSVSKEEWGRLDIITKWLISTRAAVLVMTLTSSLLAGLFAWREDLFSFPRWIALTIGLILAHASNNLLNDYVDHARGVDEKNYFRAMYGPHPLADQLMTRRQHLAYFVTSALLALLCGLYLLWQSRFDGTVWFLLGAGAFFLLFYTWPLKYIALGEIAVLIVWGPLMIGGGYYAITHHWDWNATLASIVYALGVTTVIFGKHIDKLEQDREKNIRTLPVLIGERLARKFVIGMMILPYFIIAALISIGYFSPIVLVSLLAIPRLMQVLPAFFKPKPHTRPTNFPEGQGGWPLYFAPIAFWYNRAFGMWFLFGLLADTTLKIL